MQEFFRSIPRTLFFDIIDFFILSLDHMINTYLINLIYFFFKFSFKFLEENSKSINKKNENDDQFHCYFHKVVFLKIIINMLQIMSLAKRLNLGWPSTINGLFFSYSKVSDLSEQIFSFECLLSNSYSSSDLFYLKLLLVFALPFLANLFFVSFSSLTKLIKSERIIDFSICSFCITTFLLQPIILQKTLSIFSCKKIETGKYFISSSLINECYTAEYFKYVIVHHLYKLLKFPKVFFLAVPSLIIWIFMVPFYGIFFVNHKKTDLLKTETKLRFGYIYLGYRNHYSLWYKKKLF